MRPLPIGWVALALAVSSACTRPRTEIVAVVSSPLTWGSGMQLQSVVLTARRGGSTGTVLSARTTVLGPAADEQPLPLSVGVVRADESNTDPVWIEVLGCAAADGCTVDTAVVAQRAVVGFSPEQTLELPLRLEAACVGVRCASDERCTNGGTCELATRAQSMLSIGDEDGGVITSDTPVVVDNGMMPDGNIGPDDGGIDAPDAIDTGEPDDAGDPLDVPQSVPGQVGSPCAAASDCESGYCAPASVGYPGGACAQGCPDGLNCGAGAICVVVGNVRACGHECHSDGDCRPGFFCLAAGGGSICQVRCSTNPALLCGELQCNPATDQCTGCGSGGSSCSSGSACVLVKCACTESTDCGPGRHCLTTGSCGCLDDRACIVGSHCNPSNGECV